MGCHPSPIGKHPATSRTAQSLGEHEEALMTTFEYVDLE